MIPKVIHYCWFGENPLPSDVKKCIKSWKKYCPDYEIIEWNESNFDINCHPFVKSAYDAKAWAFVSDFARLKIIYDNGGIYFDTDVEVLKTFDFLLCNQCFISVQQVGGFCTTGLGFGASKYNDVVKRMIEQYDNLIFNLDEKEKLACPFLNSKVFDEMGYKYTDQIVNIDGTVILPSKYMDPLAPGNTKNLLCNETISIHHYSASWMSKSNRLRRKLFRLIGDEKVYRIKKLLGYSKL